jgi:hypothetical protein
VRLNSERDEMFLSLDILCLFRNTTFTAVGKVGGCLMAAGMKHIVNQVKEISAVGKSCNFRPVCFMHCNIKRGQN